MTIAFQPEPIADGVPVEDQYPRLAPKVPETLPDALVDSIRAELQEMLSRPVTHLTLDAAAKYCFAASKLLLNRAKTKTNLRAADAAAFLASNPSGSVGGVGMITMPNGDMIDVDQPTMYEPAMDGVLSMAPQSETYGVRAMRELMEALGKMQEKKSETPEMLVKAIAEARALGMHDLVKQLCERLGVAPPADSPPNTKKRKRRKQ